MKGTAFSGNLPFAEFADGQISQGVVYGQISQAGKSLGRIN
jgi:hypothetical protein